MNPISRVTAAVAVIAVASVIACTPAVDTPAVDTGALAKTLTQLDDDWSKAAGTKDVDRVASFYADDAIAYPPSEPIAAGQPAAKKVWAAYFADSTFAISWKTNHAEVAKSGDLGFTTGTYEASWKRSRWQSGHPEGKVPLQLEEAAGRVLEGDSRHVELRLEVATAGDGRML